MDRTCQVLVICYLCFIMFVVVDFGDASDKIVSRQRRYLGFRNISHFFVRLNFKANMVPWNQIFAQAIGFRVNWDDPPDSFYPHHHVHRRSLYERMEVLLDRNGLSGFHCVRRAICEVQDIENPQEIYFKILKIIFRRISSDTDKWHDHTTDDCEISTRTCPFSLLQVLPYTDL
ncbi:uncharacterized protein LOC121734497 [Aricia agestis]|uniref:uncharacterized protein LOC121734497 n=1 Tax=Aricia agestis TaxID=91739 RepID=UPI001C20315A|nr:uncharacterized protein LOC121734497 [Aricia agestis]